MNKRYQEQIELDKDALNSLGIAYSQDILNLSIDLDDALKNSYKHLSKIAENFAEKVLSS